MGHPGWRQMTQCGHWELEAERLVDRAAPAHVVDKNQEDTLWASKHSHRPDCTPHDSSAGKESLITSGCKPSGDWVAEETARSSGEQGTNANPATLGTSTKTAAEEGQLHTGSGWSDWKWGAGQASPQKSASSSVVPFDPLYTHGATVAPPWQMPKILPHTT